MIPVFRVPVGSLMGNSFGCPKGGAWCRMAKFQFTTRNVACLLFVIAVWLATELAIAKHLSHGVLGVLTYVVIASAVFAIVGRFIAGRSGMMVGGILGCISAVQVLVGIIGSMRQ